MPARAPAPTLLTKGPLFGPHGDFQMRRRIHETLLMIGPLAVTAAVSLASPWLHAQGLRAAPASAAERYDRTLALACEASHRAQAGPATRGAAGARTQSPQWQREQRAAVEQCLRDGLRVIRTARAAQ